ncbi:sigma 54-interacting transcriptional regulator, partial [Clostridioides difficile]|nr:sigma 54-interacting transcriptional regulator [Clostridioides difficile]
RSDKPMVSINCAAIPEELLESELFGYDEGAFTGAKKGGKKGKFLVANNGTIFLDEIGDMPLTMQAKLLRVLQESEIEPVGGLKTIKIDVRVISATRKNLSKMVEEGLFREDLYYRLNVINIHMMELKDRQDDILLLANYILNKLNVEYKELKVLSDKVKNCFINYTWPGNIRELQNVIKSAYAVSDDMVIMMCDLPSKMDNISRVAQCNVDSNCSIHEMVENYEKSLIIDVLRKYNWKCSKAAEVMGIHKSLLYKKIKKYEIELNN